MASSAARACAASCSYASGAQIKGRCRVHQLRRSLLAFGHPCHPSSARSSHLTWAGPEDGPAGGEDLSDILKADLERFQRSSQASGGVRAQQQAQPMSQKPAPSSSPIKEAIDKVLIADFFLVLVILAWFVAGLTEKGALHSSALLDAWMPLWPLLWQPAIGLLMAGALASGGISWLQSRGAEQQKR